MSAEDHIQKAESVLADAPTGETREMAAWRHLGASTEYNRALVEFARDTERQRERDRAEMRAQLDRIEDSVQALRTPRLGLRAWLRGRGAEELG